MTSAYFQICSILFALTPATIDTHLNTSNKYFKPGEAVVLECKTKGEIKDMIWSYNTAALNYFLTEGIHINTKYNNSIELTGNEQHGEYNLRIFNITRREQGIYICFNTSQTYMPVKVNLKIDVPPSGIKIVNISDFGIIIGREGQVFNLTCKVIGGHSNGQIYWRNLTDFTSRSPEDFSWPMSHLSIVAGYEHDGMKLTCVASHRMLKDEIQTSVTFRIIYTPKIEIYRYPTGDIKEGQEMKLTCLDISNPPETNMTWRKDGVILSSNPIYEKANLKTNDSGNYSCIVSNSLGTELDNIFILVKKSYDEHNNDADSSIQMEALLVVVIYIIVCCCGTFIFCSATCIYPKCRKVRKRTTVL